MPLSLASALSFNVQPSDMVSTTSKLTYNDVYKQHTKDLSMGVSKKSFLQMDDDVGGDGEGLLTVTTASFNLANAVIGAGIVGLAFVPRSSGLIPFGFFISLAAYIAVKTLDMLASSAEMTGKKDYESIGVAALGNTGKWATAISLMGNCYGGLTAYLVLIVSTAPAFAKALNLEINARVLQVGITFGIVTPLCFLRSVNALACSAIFAIIVYMVVAATAVYSAFFDTWYTDVAQVVIGDEVFPACPMGDLLWFGSDIMSIASKFPTIIFAFVCHSAALPIFQELDGHEYVAMQKVDRFSIGMAYVLYLSVGVSGYVAFGNNTFSSVLLNLRHCTCKDLADCASGCSDFVCADDSTFSSILNVCFLMAVIMGYPALHFALRNTLITITLGGDTEFSWPVHIGVALFNILLTLGIAIVIPDIGVVFNWSGAIASPLISLVLPSLFFWILHRRMPLLKDHLGPVQAAGALGFGVGMVVLGVALNIM